MNSSWLLPALLWISAGDGKDKGPRYEIVVKKVGAEVAVREEKSRTLFVVTSQTGIGGATVRLASGAWPRDVAVRFLYSAQKGFATLESVRLTTARLQAHGALAQSRKV